MSSGVKVTDEVKQLYALLHMNSTKQEKLTFAVFKFADDNETIIIDRAGKKGDEGWEYDSLVAQLPPLDVRYIAYDFAFINKEGNPASKVVLCSWCPADAPIKKKMLGASSFNIFKSSVGKFDKALEADCISEIDSNAVLEKVGGQTNVNK